MGAMCSENSKVEEKVEVAQQPEEQPEETAAPEGSGEAETKLWVTIVAARGVRNADTWWPRALSGSDNKSDCYAALRVAGKELGRTGVESDTLEPVWIQEFEIKEWEKGQDLEFEVWDKDPLKPDDLLGKCTLSSSAFEESGFNGEVKLLDAGKDNALIKIKVKLPGQGYPEGMAMKKTVIVTKATAKQSLGLDLDTNGTGMLYVENVKGDGAVKAHNDNNAGKPDNQLAQGDFIVSVNGKDGSSEELIGYLKKEVLKFELVVKPAMTVYTYIGEKDGDMTAPLGLEFHPKVGPSTLLIKDLIKNEDNGGPESLVSQWNTKMPAHEIMKGDRIISVGGKSGKGKELKQILDSKPKKPFQLVVVRPPGDEQSLQKASWQWK